MRQYNFLHVSAAFLAKLNASGIRKAPQPLVFSARTDARAGKTIEERSALASKSVARCHPSGAASEDGCHATTSLPGNCPKFASWIAV